MNVTQLFYSLWGTPKISIGFGYQAASGVRPLFFKTFWILIHLKKKEWYTLSIISFGANFFIHDSHSCDQFGRPHGFGTAILLKFSSFLDISRYLHYLYQFLGCNLPVRLISCLCIYMSSIHIKVLFPTYLTFPS